jgi:hypothetical protein
MEKCFKLALTVTLPMNQPTPSPSQEGSRMAGARRQFPSQKGSQMAGAR